MSARAPLTAAAIEPLLDEWLETEFTFHPVEPLAGALGRLAREEQDFVLDWIRRIATTHITLALQFAQRAPDMLRRLDRRAIEAWAVHLCDTYDRAGMYAALAVTDQARAYSGVRHDHTAGALFDDIAGVLGNFVRGLSGRRLKIEQGDGTWTDGEKIVLPAIVAAFEAEADNFRLAKASVALLWAQTLFGTLNLDPGAACAAFPDPARALRQFNGLETLRHALRRTAQGLGA